MRSLVHPMIWMLLVPSFAAGLSACGEDEDDEPADREAPVVELVFPTQSSAVESRTLIMRGTATDIAGVAAVRVDGVLARTDNGFADWQAEVALEPGLNTVSIEAEDMLGNAKVVAAPTVFSSEMLRLRSEAMVLDEAANRVLIMDQTTETLVAMDVTTGVRQVISKPFTDDGRYLGDTGDLALDRDGNRVLAINGAEAALMAIDLDTGVRTLLSEQGTEPNVLLQSVTSLILDPAAGRLLAVNTGLGALIAVDLATGAPTVISDATTGAGPAFADPRDVALDAARGRALVVEGAAQALLAVDLATGDRTVLSDAATGAGPAFELPTHALLYPKEDRILVYDNYMNALLAIDPATGDRSMISDGLVGDIPVGGDALELDTARDRILAASTYWNGLVSTDLASGDRAELAHIAVGSGETLELVQDVRIDQSRGRALMVRYSQILAMDLTQSERQAIVAFNDDTSVALRNGIAMAFDPRTNQALVIDTEPVLPGAVPGSAGTGAAALAPEARGPRPALIAIDLETSAARYVVDLSDIAPIQVEMDAPRNRVLLLDGTAPILWAVDLDTGALEVVVDASSGSGSSLNFADFAVDPSRNRVVVTDVERQEVWAIDLATSERVMLAEQDAGFLLGDRGALTMDLARDRALVLNASGSSIMAIDLETRERAIVLDSQQELVGVVPERLTAPAMDEVHDRGIVIDELQQALIMVDFATGASAVIAL
jgi:uncharacterized protein YrrD